MKQFLSHETEQLINIQAGGFQSEVTANQRIETLGQSAGSQVNGWFGFNPIKKLIIQKTIRWFDLSLLQ